jgi:hypothetical protein
VREGTCLLLYDGSLVICTGPCVDGTWVEARYLRSPDASLLDTTTQIHAVQIRDALDN